MSKGRYGVHGGQYVPEVLMNEIAKLEEAYEFLSEIDKNNIEGMKEELGDVLLQVVLHAQIAKDNGDFDIEDVAKELTTKLIHRHPHVFGDVKVNSTEDIINNWDALKKEENRLIPIQRKWTYQ